MPRYKNPKSVAEITAADKKNPARYADVSEPEVSPIGDPPARFTANQKAIWKQFTSEIPWLRRSDRAFLEMTCLLRSRMETDPSMGVSALGQYRLCLAAMGATPVDRGKIVQGDDPDDDPASEFIN